jgi:hypothetical protein
VPPPSAVVSQQRMVVLLLWASMPFLADDSAVFNKCLKNPVSSINNFGVDENVLQQKRWVAQLIVRWR